MVTDVNMYIGLGWKLQRYG